jgi:group I intron endonuclease
MKSGIYVIICKQSKKMYIGQSKNVKKRFNTHMYHLKIGRHGNHHLKSAYEKYGKENFEFKILEYCELDLLDEREKFYFDLYKSTDPNFGFNILSEPKFAKAMKAKWDDPEYKESLSKKAKERWKDPEFREKNLKGIRKHHEEQIEKFGCLAFNTPESRKKNIEICKKLAQDPEYIKQKSDFAYKQLEDPVYAEQNLKRLAEGRKSPKRAENLKKHNEWQATNEEHKNMLSDLQKSYWNNEEHKNKRIESIRKAMKDPEIQRKKAESFKKTIEKRKLKVLN